VNKEEFLSKLNDSVPSHVRDSLYLKIATAIAQDNPEKAIRYLHIYHSCFPNEIIKEELIERTIAFSPWVYFRNVPSKRYLQVGIAVFRKRLCRMLVDQYIKFKPSLDSKDADQILNQIVTSLEHNLQKPKEDYSTFLLGSHFAPTYLHSGTLPSIIITCYLIVSIALDQDNIPASVDEYIEAINDSKDILLQTGILSLEDINYVQATLKRISSNSDD